MLLTIAVPTYNRAESVMRLLFDLLTNVDSLPVEILVLDDGSKDDTFTRLSNDALISSNARLLQNGKNLGYPQTFMRAFSECATEYIMFVADDDQVAAEHLGELVDYLERERPAFVSPQFMRGASVYRGRGVTGPIAPSEFSAASAHASGLVYRVESCGMALSKLSERIEAEEADALVYPQVVLLVWLLIGAEKCEWLALPTATEGSYEPSGIRDADGRHYWALESRWQQLKAFESLLVQCVGQDTSGTAQQILNTQRSYVFSFIASAIRSESPVLGSAFDLGAKKAFRWGIPKAIVRLLASWRMNLSRKFMT